MKHSLIILLHLLLLLSCNSPQINQESREIEFQYLFIEGNLPNGKSVYL